MNNNHLTRPKATKINRKLFNAHLRKALRRDGYTRKQANEVVRACNNLNATAAYTKAKHVLRHGA